MIARFKLADPDKAEATLTVTMPLGEWKRIHAAMGNLWPEWQFAAHIREMISEAEKTFYRQTLEDEKP